MSGTVLTALAVEAAALRGVLRPGVRAARTGMGPVRAATAGRGLAGSAPSAPGAARDAVLLAGLAGGTGPGVVSGDLVVASEVRGAGVPVVALASAPLLAGALRRAGLRTHLGPVATSASIVTGPARAALGGEGVLAVDMESAALAGALRGGAGDVPLAVVRAVVDTAEHPLLRPGTAVRGVRALWALRRTGPVLGDWLAATGPREVLRSRFPAVRSVARRSDLVLVLGSADSSGSVRLAEVAEREGAVAHLVEDVGDVDLRWLAGARTVGVTAAASVPPHLLDELVDALRGLGPTAVPEDGTPDEDVVPTRPRETHRETHRDTPQEVS